jgi:hypothetical protein
VNKEQANKILNDFISKLETHEAKLIVKLITADEMLDSIEFSKNKNWKWWLRNNQTRLYTTIK